MDLSYRIAILTFAVCLAYNRVNGQFPWFGNQNRNQNAGGSGSGSNVPNWFQMADQFMSNWMSSINSRRNDTGTQSGGFFDSLFSGIVSFSNEMTRRDQNSSSFPVPPRVQRLQNRTREWFNNWMNNFG